MWLINTTSYQLEEFVPEQAPAYAILSHRWGDEEVLFRHMHVEGAAQARKGWQKILGTCEKAVSNNIAYAWVDTCCINKDSSAELSEAINSMFEWYAKSEVCYVYLEDVRCCPLQEEEFFMSAWFTRGWTLQELIAPRNLIFWNKDWSFLGTKINMLNSLSRATNIDEAALWGHNRHSFFSVGTRMAWAAKRTTTRREDQAYCLLGLFNVNMPLLYGEGDRAFLRLQEEILRRENDPTIFLWQSSTTECSGLLAPSIRCFQEFPTSLFTSNFYSTFDAAFTLTNQGLSIPLTLRPLAPCVYAACFTFVRYEQDDLQETFEIALARRSVNEHRYWYRLNSNPLTVVEHGPALMKWRGWDHEIQVSKPKEMSITVDEKHNINDEIEPDLVKQRYEVRVAVEASLNDFIEEITIPRASKQSQDSLEALHTDSYESIHSPYPEAGIECLLPESHGVVAMLKTSDLTDNIEQLALGVDFQGTTFCIATRKQLPGANDKFQPKGSGTSDSLVKCINELIDEVPNLAQVYPTYRRPRALQWTHSQLKTFHPPVIEPLEPSPEGVWAFKGEYIGEHIPLSSKNAESGEQQLLRIVTLYAGDGGKYTFFLELITASTLPDESNKIDEPGKLAEPGNIDEADAFDDFDGYDAISLD